MIWEILYTLLFVVWSMIKCIVTVIIDNLPTILQIKKIIDVTTPIGLLSMYIGVPMLVLTFILWGIRKIIRER